MKLNDREKAFEDMYANDQELHFKIRSRRNKQAGIWAAEKMGKTPQEASEYALELVTSFLDREQLLVRIKSDLAASGIDISDAEIIGKMNELIEQSRQYFMEAK